MDRRSFMATTATGAVTALAVPQSYAQAATHTPPEPRAGARVFRAALSPAFAQGYLRDLADRFILQIAQLSDGALWPTVAGGPTQPGVALTATTDFDFWLGSADELYALNPGFAYLAGLPSELGLSAPQHRAWYAAAGGELACDELALAHGFKPLPIGHTSEAAGAWATRDVATLSELQGAKVAADGLSAGIVGRLGALPTTAAADRLPGMLAEGELLLAEPPLPFVAAYADGYGIGAGNRWLRDGFKPKGTTLVCCVPAALWTGLSTHDRALLSAAATLSDNATAADVAAHQFLVAPHLRAARGITVTAFPDVIGRAIAHVATDLVARTREADTIIERLHMAYFGFRQAATGLGDPTLSNATFAS